MTQLWFGSCQLLARASHAHLGLFWPLLTVVLSIAHGGECTLCCCVVRVDVASCVSGECVFTVGDDSVPIRQGVPYMFDQRVMHGLTNNMEPGAVRINLMIDVVTRVSPPWLMSVHNKVTESVGRTVAHGLVAHTLPQYNQALVDGVVLRPTGPWHGFAKFATNMVLRHGADVKRLQQHLLHDAGLSLPPHMDEAQVVHLLGLVVQLHYSIEAGLYVMSMVPAVRFATTSVWAAHVVANGIPGGFVEAGVWRGGMVIAMKQLSDELSNGTRTVYALDSFDGMEDIAESSDSLDIPEDRACSTVLNEARKVLGTRQDLITASASEVRDNLVAALGPNGTDNVELIAGFFSPSYPWHRVGQLSILRIDCDYYKPTMLVLQNLYDKLSVGGVVILDEYYLPIMGEGRAVDEFRAARGITSPIVRVDHQSAYWVKRAEGKRAA